MSTHASGKPVTVFSGFPEGKMRTVPVPEPFFGELLPGVDHLGELKLSLYTLWYFSHQDLPEQYLTLERLLTDEKLRSMLADSEGTAQDALADALRRSVARGFLLERQTAEGSVYFLNSANGRRTARLLETGEWSPASASGVPQLGERPNLFSLYEQNIGPLTPMVADMIKDSMEEYPQDWIADAMTIAIKKNARNWRYIEAILTSWQENGRQDSNRRDKDEDYKRFASGDYSELIER